MRAKRQEKKELQEIMEKSKGHTASIGQIRATIKYAYFDDELYNILEQDIFRLLFQDLLINTYLKEY